MLILTLYCRNVSVRYQLFDWELKKMVAGGVVERVFVGGSYITHHVPGRRPEHRDHDCDDHKGAIALILRTLTDARIGVIDNVRRIYAVGHKVVHGGERFVGSVLINPKTVEDLKETLTLAPLDNAPNLQGIEGARELLSGVPQVAVFDTAFHHTMPEAAFLYPLPYEWYQKHGVRRYGFHGLSHYHASRRGAAFLRRAPEECTVLTVHTGDGVSLCLVQKGASIDTSMGFSPLEGVMMGTRCGNIDAGIIPFIIQQEGISLREMDLVLNRKSGSAGIAGRCASSHLLMQEALDGCPRCQVALDMEAFRLKKFIGSYIAVANPDAIVFTYAEGWADWPIRRLALSEMEQFGIRIDVVRDGEAIASAGETLVSADDSRIPVLVTPSGEDLVLNAEVVQVLRKAKWQPPG